MKSAVIFLFILSASSVAGSIYFQQIGILNPSPSYGHVHFMIDTPIIMTQLQNVKEAIAYVRKAVHTFSHQSVQNRARNFLVKAHLDIDTMINEFKDLQSVFNDTTLDSSRVKRFLGLLLAMGSITMSLFNQAEILHLQGEMSDIVTRQHHIVDILQEHEVAIHTLQHDVVTIRDQFLAVINMVEENNAIAKIHEAELEIIMAMAELRRTLACIQNGIPHLLMHRVPLCFLDTKQIKISIKQLSVRAAKRKLELVSQHISAFLQYETSFLMIHGQAHVYVHVPLVDRNNLLDLLQFNNAQTQISDTLAVQLAPATTILAVGTGGVHTTLTQSELDRYSKYGQYFFGDSALILERSINSSCLGAIYAQDFSNLKKVCPVKFLKSNENFHKIASNVFLFWTSEPQTVQIKCESATNHMAVQQNEKITLASNCAIITKSHIIRSGQDLNVEAKIKQWPANWNVSQLLFDLEPATLAAQIHNLNLISYPATPPRDLQNLINQTQPHTLNTMMIIVLVATFLLFLIIIFLGIRYCKLKNQSSPK